MILRAIQRDPVLGYRAVSFLDDDPQKQGQAPHLSREWEDIGPAREAILAAYPGITGIWQVSGKSDLDYDERIALDVWYIRNWSPWLDLIILIRTVKIVLKKEGQS